MEGVKNGRQKHAQLEIEERPLGLNDGDDGVIRGDAVGLAL